MAAFVPSSASPFSTHHAGNATLDALLREEYTETYPHHIWYIVAAFIGLVSLFQWISYAFNRFSVGPSARTAPITRFCLFLLNVYRAFAFRTTVGVGSYSLNVAEVLCAAIYIAVLWSWELINATDSSGKMFSPAYMSSRAGAIATSQFPLITALGTKNNVVGALTGLSYEKLNAIHRMCARTCFVLLWLHGGLKLHSRTDGRWGMMFLQMGLLGMVAFSILVLISLRPVRSKAYELFFYSHFVLVLLFLVGGYYHTRPYQFNPYIYASFIIWGLDRLIRVVRITVNNFAPSSHTAPTLTAGMESMATVEHLSPHLLRLRVKRPKHFHWSPGQTAYLITPSVSRIPFEAHPFTIASYDMSKTEHVADDHGAEKSVEKQEGEMYWQELVFLVNVREGFTKRLGATDGPVKVLLDGPYGSSPSLDNFDRIILIAGGSGVSFTLPLLMQAIEHSRKPGNRCKRVVFIWAIRDITHVQWISDALREVLSRAHSSGLELELQIYVTQAKVASAQWDDASIKTESEAELATGSDESPGTSLSLEVFGLGPTVTHSGRPDMEAILMEEASHAKGENMAVNVCGSYSVAQSVRSALRNPLRNEVSILNGGPNVYLHVESFGYA